jgi:hypothetical protein
VFVEAGDVENSDDFRSRSGSEGDPRVVNKVAEHIVAECDVESCDRLAENCGCVDSLVVILGKDVGERLNPETEASDRSDLRFAIISWDGASIDHVHAKSFLLSAERFR